MEIHIGERVTDVTLVSKDGNKVQLLVDGVPYDVDVVMAKTVAALFCTMESHIMPNLSVKKVGKVIR